MIINYNKKIHFKRDFPYPYLMCDEWIVTPEGIKTEEGIILNPPSLQLLLWKSAFYDRGLKSKHLFPDSVEYK